MRKRWALTAGGAVAVLSVAVGAFFLIREQRIEAARCEEVGTLAAALRQPLGHGEPLTVIGDSYSQGWGLDDPRTSWVAELPRTATVHAASGSGYTREGLCNGKTVLELAADTSGETIVQAGLNDADADPADLKAAAIRAISSIGGDVTLVGPALAPSFDASALRAVDEALASAAAETGAEYVSALGWTDLQYVDGIHLTPNSHHIFGTRVAQALDG